MAAMTTTAMTSRSANVRDTGRRECRQPVACAGLLNRSAAGMLTLLVTLAKAENAGSSFGSDSSSFSIAVRILSWLSGKGI